MTPLRSELPDQALVCLKVKYLNFAITKTVTFVNIFAEVLHTGRRAEVMKHIKQDFSLKV